MKRKNVLLLILALFLSLVSCSKKDVKTYYKNQDFTSAYNIASANCQKRIKKEDLYYKALSAVRCGKNDDGVNAAKLYLSLFTTDYADINSMAKIVLHYGDSSSAIEAADILMNSNAMQKDDLIQYYNVLNQCGYFSKANEYLSTLSSMLTLPEYTLCLINGGASTWQIVSALESLYQEEGVSENLLTALRIYLPSVSKLGDRASVESFLRDSFNGSAEYAIIIGDYYFDTNDILKMHYYWNIAASKYPEAVEARIKVAKSKMEQ